jgi:hypothetical protein
MEPQKPVASEDREVDDRFDPNWSEATRAIVKRIQREWEQYDKTD